MDKVELKQIIDKIRDQTPRGWILMSPNSIGEVLITCAFARSLIEKSGYPITLCVRPEHVSMVEALYPNSFTAIVPMSMEMMRAFSETGLIKPGHFDIDFPINLSPLHYEGGYLLEQHNLIYKRHGASGLSLLDVWRSMLQLDWDAPVEKPCLDYFERDNGLLQRFGVEKGRYTLFLPGNNTNIPAPAVFWEKLEAQYAGLGLPVLVNIKGAMLFDRALRIYHGRQVDLDVMEALYLIYHSHTTVSGNNGLMLVSAFAAHNEGPGPFLHVITTDKYCKHYDRLGTQWEQAFVPYDGQPSICLGAPELIMDSKQVYEWNITSGLNAGAYQKAAQAIFSLDRQSSHFVDPGTRLSHNNFPRPLIFKS